MYTYFIINQTPTNIHCSLFVTRKNPAFHIKCQRSRSMVKSSQVSFKCYFLWFTIENTVAYYTLKNQLSMLKVNMYTKASPQLTETAS